MLWTKIDAAFDLQKDKSLQQLSLERRNVKMLILALPRYSCKSDPSVIKTVAYKVIFGADKMFKDVIIYVYQCIRQLKRQLKNVDKLKTVSSFKMGHSRPLFLSFSSF